MSEEKSRPSLSIIVPVYNRADDLETLLRSLEPELHRTEVIVVDDGSPDADVYDHLKARYPGVWFVRQDHNRGPAAARNRGAREATNELLFFVDSDTAIVPGTIDTIFRVYEENPDFVACGGTSDLAPLNEGFFPHYKALLETSWVLDREHGITYVGHIGSRAFTIRRSVMLELGGFDDTLPTADVEDYEFGYRLRQAYGPIPFCTQIRVRHRYDTLLTQARLYFRRVILWWALRGRTAGADDVGSTSREAAGAVLCTLLTLAVIVGLIVPGVWYAVVALVLAVLLLHRSFFRLCMLHRGPWFTVRALVAHVFLSWFICAGAAVAILRSAGAAVLRGRRAMGTAFSFGTAETRDA